MRLLVTEMYSSVIIVLALAANTAVANHRIVGGSVTTIEQYPFAAALLKGLNLAVYTQDCGGTILNIRSILSAAHCFVGHSANQWRTRVGSTWASSGGTVVNTQQIIMHPNYNSWSQDSDIAILRLSSTISFSNSVRAGSIAGSNYNVADNQVVWAIGWGFTSVMGPSSEVLRHVQIWTVNRNTCNGAYGFITDNMLCSGWFGVGGRDQCTGDSGGPLIHNGVVVGVCSFGNGCADARFPGVNAFVPRFTTWIQANA